MAYLALQLKEVVKKDGLDLILSDASAFEFRERSRRPPLDPVNALLSFLYTLLTHDIRGAIESVGLDSFVGFLHRDRRGRAGLALDLMEELRPFVADRLALSLINRKQIREEHFRHAGDRGGVDRELARGPESRRDPRPNEIDGDARQGTE